jgi:hypothetical protein
MHDIDRPVRPRRSRRSDLELLSSMRPARCGAREESNPKPPDPLAHCRIRPVTTPQPVSCSNIASACPTIPSQPTRAAPNPRRPCWKSGLASSLHQRNIKGGRRLANHVANPSRHDAVAHSSGLTTTTRLKPSRSRAKTIRNVKSPASSSMPGIVPPSTGNG